MYVWLTSFFVLNDFFIPSINCCIHLVTMLIKSQGIPGPGEGLRMTTRADRSPGPRSSAWSALQFLALVAQQNHQVNSDNYRHPAPRLVSQLRISREVGGSISILKAALVKLMCRPWLSDRQKKENYNNGRVCVTSVHTKAIPAGGVSQ